MFSGSDINLDEITEANKAKIVNDNEIILSQLPNLQPVIAKRHFFETGTQRIFQKFCIVLGNVKKSVEDIVRLDVSKISAGSFVYVIKTVKQVDICIHATTNRLRSNINKWI